MDEPRATQPIMYSEIDNHPTVTEIFGNMLKQENLVNDEDISTMKENVQSELEAIYESMTEDTLAGISEVKMPDVLASSIDLYEKAVTLDELKKLNEDLLKRPEDFKQFKRLNRVFNRRDRKSTRLNSSHVAIS